MDNGDLTNLNPKKGALMTNDELQEAMFKLRAEMLAMKSAQDALMVALPEPQQVLWLQALQTLLANKTLMLVMPGVALDGVNAQIAAMRKRADELERARTGLVKAAPK
jgi:hypothetical protein